MAKDKEFIAQHPIILRMVVPSVLKEERDKDKDRETETKIDRERERERK